MSNFIIAIIRTVVPIIVGWVVAQLARVGLDMPAEVVAETTTNITLLAASLYYIAVAWLERKWAWFGWLLGVARNPVYEPKHSEIG